MQQLLIIDDDTELCALLEEYLGGMGFSCRCAHRAETGIALAAENSWDLIVLDVMLPGQSGLEVLRHIRSLEATKHLPVLMLSARGGESDKIVGLEMGADDYLVKPFSAGELLARIRALLRRTGTADASAQPKSLQVGDLHVLPGSLRVSVAGHSVEVSAVELRLLEALIEAPGTVVNRDFLYHALMGHTAHPFDRRLDMTVSRLRKKLGPHEDGSERIRAVRGEGYMYLLTEPSL